MIRNNMYSNSKKYKVLCIVPENEFKKPFEYGWKREFIKKLAPVSNSSKESGEVYYISPTGTRCRLKKEIESHLHDSGLDVNMFTFARRALGFEGETVKTATAKGYKAMNDCAISGNEDAAPTIENAENGNAQSNLLNNQDKITRPSNTESDSNRAIFKNGAETTTIGYNGNSYTRKESSSKEQILRPRILNTQNKSIPETKQSPVIDQINSTALRIQNKTSQPDEIAILKQQLREKDEIIGNLKICLARNEAEITKMQKQQDKPPISHEQLKLEISKVLPMFSPNQLALMMKEKKRVNWTSEEISRGFAHSYLGKRGYNFTRIILRVPEPSIRTLHKWGEKITIAPGILEDCFEVLKALRKTLTEGESQVVLTFDEMKCKSLYEYNKTLDLVMGPHNQMQTIMARGLFSKFKQPIYVDFDKNVTYELLMTVITKLHNIAFNVVACVNDNGGSNVGLWTKSGVNYEKTTLTHPVTGSKIFMFSDAPHLIKLLRNWFLDGGFLLEDGTELNQGKIRQLLKMNTEISPVHHISLKHLMVEGPERQDVRIAAQLFSHSVAQSLLKQFPSDPEATKLAEFIELVNNWFDLANSYSIQGIFYKKPYGVDLTQQNAHHICKTLFTK